MMDSALVLVLNELCSTSKVGFCDGLFALSGSCSNRLPLAAALVATGCNFDENDAEGEEQPPDERRKGWKDRRRVQTPRVLTCGLEDPAFRKHFGMDKVLMEQLFRQIHAKIFSAEDARGGRGFFSPSPEKVLQTVWLLCTRETFREAAIRFGVSKGGIHMTFINTCVLIIRNSNKFIGWPGHDEQMSTARRFESIHGFPGVVGVVGEHAVSDSVKCRAKAKVVSAVVVLQAVCDADQRFLDLFVSKPICTKPIERRLFRQTPLFSMLASGSSVGGDYHLLGDLSYPLMNNLLVPFAADPTTSLSREQSEYNRIHREARAVLPRTFSRLVGRFKRLSCLNMSRGDLVTTVVHVACCLHNFIAQHEDPESSDWPVDPEGCCSSFDEPESESDGQQCSMASDKRDLVASLLGRKMDR